jgi:phage shock protein A
MEVSEKRVVDTQKLLDDATTNLGVTMANIDELSGLLVSGQDTREKQEAAYVIAKEKARQAMEALDEAISLISSMQQGRSFIQVKSRIEEVTSKL